MANEAVARIEKEISRDRGLLEELESGRLHEADPDQTQARIDDLKRRIATNETLLIKYGA